MNEYRNIEISEFATSSATHKYLLGYGGRFYEASRALVELLRALQSHDSEEEGIDAYIAQSGRKYTREQIAAVIENGLTPIVKAQPRQQRRTFLYQRELLSASSIGRFSQALSVMFKPACIVAVFALTAVAEFLFFYTTPDLLKFANAINLYTIIGIMVFVVVSSFFHEMGHAAACRYYGIDHGGIGFGLYINFPIFYTDVTNVWRLGRRQRCVVNLAGVYFQCYILLALMALFYTTHWEMVKYLILTLNIGLVVTLNPFFKFDGYWLASDMLGIPNLRQRTREFARYLLDKLRRRPITAKPYLLQTGRKVRYTFVAYAVAVNLFMGYYFLYLIPTFLYKFYQDFPGEVRLLVNYLSYGIEPPFALIRNMSVQLLFVAILCYFVWNMVTQYQNKRRRVAQAANG